MDDDRRIRHARILEWYGDSPDLPGASCSASDLVVGRGLETGPVARWLATKLGREHEQLDDPVELLDSRASAPRSVIVVAEADWLGIDGLRALQRRFDEAGVLLGLVTGRDRDAIDFMARKLVAQRSSEVPRPPRPNMKVGSDSERLGPDARLRSLERDFTLLSILSHSEGAHCLVDGVVLCGLAEQIERHRGAAVEGGCSEEACKRAAIGPFERTLVRSLRCEAMLLCCCNGLSLAREHYPSDTSIAHAAIDGYPSAILAQLGSAFINRADLEFLDFMLVAGVRFGALCRLFNTRASVGDKHTCCCLIGDPLASLTPTPASLEAIVDRPEVSRLPRERAGEPVTLAAEARGTTVFQREDELLVIHPGITRERVAAWAEPAPAIAELHAAIEHAATERLWLRTWLTGLGASLATVAGAEARVAELLELLGLLDLGVGRSAAAWTKLLDSRIREPGLEVLATALAEILDCIHARLVELVEAHLLDESIGGDRLVTALDFGLIQTRSEPGPRCRRCGAITDAQHHRSIAGEVERLILDCPNCGVRQHRAPGSVALDLVVALEQRPARLELRVVGLDDADPSRDQVLVEHRDIVRQRSTVQRMRTVELLERGWTVELPPDAGPDLHTLKLVRVRGLELVYARALIPVVPC